MSRIRPIALRAAICALVTGFVSLPAAPSYAMSDSEPMIGEMRNFGFNFCPRGWEAADGQLLAISSNTALFSLIGINFGGDGRSTFALPDMRSRISVSNGRSTGGTTYPLAQSGGAEQVTLTTSELPAHNHSAAAYKGAANQRGPGGDYFAFAQSAAGEVGAYHNGPADTTLSPTMIQPAGGSQPHENRMPYLASTWCIATQGIYPSRD